MHHPQHVDWIFLIWTEIRTAANYNYSYITNNNGYVVDLLLKAKALINSVYLTLYDFQDLSKAMNILHAL